MEKFTIYTGTTVPLMNDNIDTDQILPKQFLKLIDKKGFGKYLMYAWRYLDDQYTILGLVPLGSTQPGLWQIMVLRSLSPDPSEIYITIMSSIMACFRLSNR